MQFSLYNVLLKPWFSQKKNSRGALTFYSNLTEWNSKKREKREKREKRKEKKRKEMEGEKAKCVFCKKMEAEREYLKEGYCYVCLAAIQNSFCKTHFRLFKAFWICF